jgi:hypothetical protein
MYLFHNVLNTMNLYQVIYLKIVPAIPCKFTILLIQIPKFHIVVYNVHLYQVIYQ